MSVLNQKMDSCQFHGGVNKPDVQGVCESGVNEGRSGKKQKFSCTQSWCDDDDDDKDSIKY